MSLKEGLLSLSILIALLCVPAAVAAAGGGGPDEPYYIKVVLDEPKGYLELNIETVDALDPLDTGNTSVALQSTETGDLKAIECPLLGSITREFSPASGPYKGTNVTVTENKTVDGSTFPREYRVYTTPTIPSFTVNVPGRWGNVLLIKCPENLDIDASFTELFNTTNKEGYLFTEDGILHVRIKGTNPAGFGNPFGLPADQNSLSNTLNENRVDLSNFNFRHDALNADELHYIPQPKAGEYLLTAVEYDSASETMHVLAAMPVLILNGDTPVTWSGDTPHSQDEDVNISFGEGANVDKIAYALVKNDTTYGLQVKINTIELAKQPVPTSAVDVISILKSIAERGLLAEYILTCDTDTPNVIYNKDSCLAIVEGYGCSGANDAPSVGIAAETLATLNPGTYYLYALGMQGQNVTAVDQTEVTIVAPAPVAPVAGFSTNVTEGVAPLTVAFTDESTGATSWAWDFGDGNTSADQNPVHTYETADTYTVTLTVMNEAGSNSTTQTITVTEAPVTPAPVASFTANVTEGIAPLTVEFCDTSTNNPTSWAWDFGDGQTSTEQHVDYTYTVPGTYTVTLTVMNEAGSNSTTQTITVTEAPVTPAPVASFTTNVTEGIAPLTVEFCDTSTNNPTSWAWDFGDGQTSTEQHVDYTYTVPGTYTVNLTVMNEAGSDSTTQTITVTEAPVTPAPVASFTTNVTEGVAPLTVEFCDTSTNNPTSWAWDFGDGQTSTEQHVDYTYTVPGTYTVNLTVMNEAGSDSTTQTITVTEAPVTPAPVASFTTNVTEGVAPLTVEFCDTSTNNPTSWAWDFGDGQTSTEQHVDYTYTVPGTYTVNLTVINEAGSDSTTQTITVKDVQPETPLEEKNFTLDSDAVDVSTGEDDRQHVVFNTSGTGTVNGSDILFQVDGLHITIMTDGLTDEAGNITGVQLASAPINATVSSAGGISVSFAAEMDRYIRDLVITTSIHNEPRDRSKFNNAAKDEGFELGDIAYMVNFTKANLGDNPIRNAILRLTVSQDWVTEHSNKGDIRIFRLADDGTCEMLKTTYAGPDANGMMTITAESPDGFSSFVLAAVTDSKPPVTPTPTQISRRSSGGGGGGSSTSVGAASNLQSGDRVALSMDRTAISAVTFTAQNPIKDVMVTMAKGSLPRAAEPPAATVYQYIEATLYRAVEDDLSNIWFRFAVPDTWLAAQGCTADGVGLFRLTDDGWQEVPVEVLGEENGNALFAASPEGFSLFAIAVTEKVPGVDEPTPEPTETETTPTADVTTPPADKPTTEPTPTPGFGALVALAGLGAGAVLILRRE